MVFFIHCPYLLVNYQNTFENYYASIMLSFLLQLNYKVPNVPNFTKMEFRTLTNQMMMGILMVMRQSPSLLY